MRDLGRSSFARQLGPTTIFALVGALAFLWLMARPDGTPAGSYVGQLLGAESVLLLSIGLVLISTLPWVESWFDGIDRAAIWHRRVAIAGVALLLPHAALASNPDAGTVGPALAVIGLLGLLTLVAWAILPRWRYVVPGPLRRVVVAVRDAPWVRDLRRVFGGYDRWRTVHRTTGLFLTVGAVHGLLDATPFHGAPVLRWSYVAIGAVGVAFYLYRELLARYFVPLHDYVVDSVRRLDADLVEIMLRPLGRRLDFVPGQWAMLFLEARDGWHRHPFTISSAASERLLRVTIKALGNATSRAHLVEPGMPAVIGGPFGRFDHRVGGDRQLWIAGGVGVTPFLSWLRSAERQALPAQVDFFYSAAGDAPFAEEITAIAARHEGLHIHLIDTTVDGRLTADDMLAAVDGDRRGLSVFMCGPTGMLRAFQIQLRRAGVPGGRINREYFDWR